LANFFVIDHVAGVSVFGGCFGLYFDNNVGQFVKKEQIDFASTDADVLAKKTIAFFDKVFFSNIFSPMSQLNFVHDRNIVVLNGGM